MELVNKKISDAQLHDAIRFFLMEHNQGSLATTIDDYPRSSPVMFFLGNDLDIYIMSAGGDKFTALATNPNVCLLVNTEYLDYRKIKGVQVFGKAEVGERGSSIYNDAERYCSDKHLLDHNDMKIIKIRPTEIIYLDSTKTGDRTKQVCKIQ